MEATAAHVEMVRFDEAKDVHLVVSLAAPGGAPRTARRGLARKRSRRW